MIRSLLVLALAGACAPVALAADSVDFAARVLPIFAARCAGCHGAEKQQGKLRLDSAEAIAAFHEATLLVAGKPEDSELFQRITLPADSKKRMPKGGDPLSAEEIEVIRQWIADGAKLTPTTVDAGAPEPEAQPAPAPMPPGEEDPALAALPPASAESIAKIEAAGGTVMPLFGESPLLQVSFAQAASPPGDEAIAALAAAADNIVWLNLAKAQLSPSGLAPLAQHKNLIQLHLELSNVDDAALAHLAGLQRLEYLNLYGAKITDAGLAPLKGLARLRNLYVWQTQVSWDAAEALKAAIPGLEVNLGWDHPEVAKRRLAKELEIAKEIAGAAASRAAELEQQLTAARQAKDQSEARVKELEEQLKALGVPTAEPAAASPPAGEPAA